GEVHGRTRATEFVKSLVDVAPDAKRYIATFHAIDVGRFVSELRMAGESTEGAEVTWTTYNVSVVRDGVIASSDIYPDDALDEALARYAELGPRPGLENLCTRQLEEFARRFEASDAVGLRAILRDDFVTEDGRNLQEPILDAESSVANVVEGW